jgi:penicillin-binding protein 1A
MRVLRHLLLAGLGLAALSLALVVHQLSQLPLPTGFEQPRAAALDLLAGDTVLATRGVAYGRPVDLEALAPHLIDAVLSMEDRRFRQHRGIDLRGMLRAGLANLREGGVREGGSTITQQLVKNSFLSPERTWTRKAQEVLLALWLERRLDKSQILARYLDSVYLGAGAYGVDAASRRYFGKPPEELTLAESAMLAGLIQAPSRDTPIRSLEAAQARAGLVLRSMEAAGMVDAAAAAEASANPATLARPPAERPIHGHAVDWIAGEARAMLGTLTGEATVETTLDPRLQELAASTIERRLSGEGAGQGVSEAALVAMTPDGAVLAMAGGRDYRTSQFNRAAQARRQPGSVFKLFVYLAALEAGAMPSSPIEDAPISIGTWQPRNYGDAYLGPTDLRTAFARSANSAAVRLQERVGRERVIERARSMGIAGGMAPLPSLALGTIEASLLELTAAFAAIRADRARIEPYGVRALHTSSGRTLRPPAPETAPAPWPQAAMRELLGEVVRTGTGRRAALEVPVFGKTGTTQDHRDAWFIGFAEDLVVGVWVGNDDDTPMQGVTGGGLPAEIWRDFVGEAIRLPADRGAPEPLPETPEPEPLLVGLPLVRDTGTLELEGRVVRLAGVEGIEGRHARDMAAYIGGREVVCRPAEAGRHLCEVDGYDLSEVVLHNGGGRATAEASAVLIEAERRARMERRGIWGGP